jgi:glutaredoxin
MRRTGIITLLLLGIIGAGALSYYVSGPQPVYCKKSFLERDYPVVMFTTRWCPYCKKARQLFTDMEIAYCEYDVNASKETQDSFTRLGGSGVPLIVIGEEIFYGFNKKGIITSLNQHQMLN